MEHVAAIVLAGGASRRFGTGSKLLHPTGGIRLIEASLRAPLGAGLARVIVVTGAYHEQLAPLLAPYPVTVIYNPDWEAGMSSSMRAGLAALAETDLEAAVLCLADQPALEAAVIDRLVRVWRETGAPIVAPVAGGQRRNPVLFDRSLWPELMRVTGDEGGRSVIQRHAAELVTVAFAEAAWFADIDTLADLD